MSKFKVGDIVRVKQIEADPMFMPHPMGGSPSMEFVDLSSRLGTVVDVQSEGFYGVVIHGFINPAPSAFWEHELEEHKP